ncbi:MAG TPA: hypothetical protein VMT05_05625 [Terriglobales bacterium]|nr:hypothetical protein [Terriglobales bacterium]
MKKTLASLAITALLLGIPLAVAQDRNDPYPPPPDRNGSYPSTSDRNDRYPARDRNNPYAYPDNRGSGYPNAIPEGARFIVLLEDKLDTARIDRGKRFKAKLGDDLVAPDGSVIRRGSKIRGHVSDVEQGLHPRLILSFDQIATQHGWVPLAATVTGVPGEHGLKPETGPEGEIERPGVDKRRAAEAAVVGAGVGTLAGAAAGGGKGAAIGAAAGAGVGLGAGVLSDRNIRLEKGTQLEVQLDRPLIVPRS